MTFEVMEINNRVEAVKLLLPHQVERVEQGKSTTFDQEADRFKPDPKELMGQWVEGVVKSQHQLVKHQSWGFCSSESFAGQVFWHAKENPKMSDIEFEREDVVEFYLSMDSSRNCGKNSEVRARDMRWLRKGAKSLSNLNRIPSTKQAKVDRWKANWRDKPPPDWNCQECGFTNFGRNKACKSCHQGKRPPREEWPEDDAPPPEPGSRAAELFPNPTGARLPARITQPAWQVKQQQVQRLMMPEGTEQWPEPRASDFLPETHMPKPALIAPRMFPPAEAPPSQQRLPDLLPPAWQQQQQEQPPTQEQIALEQSASLPSTQQLESEDSRQTPQLTPEEKKRKNMVAYYMGAFNDMVGTNTAGGVGQARLLLEEVNSVMADDRAAKYAFAMELAQHPWLAENWVEVRYKPGQNAVIMSETPQQQQQQQHQSTRWW